MLLSYSELIHLVDTNVITNVNYSQVNSASIDITLGSTILREKDVRAIGLKSELWYCDRTPMSMETDTNWPFILLPGEFVLAHSEQIFNLPNNISAEYKLKSSMARIGLNHLNAGWADAGWNGSALTLELVNTSRYHSIGLTPGDAIGQVVFFKHAEVPREKSYAARGRYNGDKSVQGIKE